MKKYVEPEIKVTEFEAEDVITTSSPFENGTGVG